MKQKKWNKTRLKSGLLTAALSAALLAGGLLLPSAVLGQQAARQRTAGGTVERVSVEPYDRGDIIRQRVERLSSTLGDFLLAEMDFGRVGSRDPLAQELSQGQIIDRSQEYIDQVLNPYLERYGVLTDITPEPMGLFYLTEDVESSLWAVQIIGKPVEVATFSTDTYDAKSYENWAEAEAWDAASAAEGGAFLDAVTGVPMIFVNTRFEPGMPELIDYYESCFGIRMHLPEELDLDIQELEPVLGECLQMLLYDNPEPGLSITRIAEGDGYALDEVCSWDTSETLTLFHAI